MKKFIISAITLAILCMVFACAEPSSSNENSNNSGNTSTNTPTPAPTEDLSGTTDSGMPKTLVGNYTVTDYDYYGQPYDPSETGETIRIMIKADDTIWYSGSFKINGATVTVDPAKYADIKFCDSNSNQLELRVDGEKKYWSYAISGSTLKLTGEFETRYLAFSEATLRK